MFKLLALEELQSADIRRLYDYWDAKRGARLFPAKGDIDPADLVPCLPFMTITEIHREPLRIRYRLVGTEIVRLRGGDPTWRWMHELGWQKSTLEQFLAQYEALLRQRRPIFGVDEIIWVDRRPHIYEWSLMPLSDDGETITHAVGIMENLWSSRQRTRPGDALF